MKWGKYMGNIGVYLIVGTISIIILSLPSFPSIDGAAHLYNSVVLKDISLGLTTPLSESYTINPVPVPNYLDHVIQGFLCLFAPPLLAQKLMVVGMLLAFTIIFLSIAPQRKNNLVFLAFLPLFFSYFLYAGMNNQVMSFIVFLAFIRYLDRYEFRLPHKPKTYIILFLFSILLWSTSILGFALATGIYGLALLLRSKETFVKKALASSLSFMPMLLLTAAFLSKAKMSNAEPNIGIDGRLMNFINLDVLGTFNMGWEAHLIIALSISYFALLAFAILRLYSQYQHQKLERYILAILFGFILLVPNTIGAGMLTNRLVLYYWIFAFFIIKKYIHLSKITKLACILSFISFVLITNKAYHSHINKYAKIGQDLYTLGSKIPAGKTVWSINLTDEWFLGHSMNYASLANKSIAIENYEANYDWFPISWKEQFLQMGKHYKTSWESNSIPHQFDIPADYVIIYGKMTDEWVKYTKASCLLEGEKGGIKIFKMR